jgi:hypothetical protein
MKALGTKLALQAALLSLLFGAAVPLRAQPQRTAGSDLYVCNKGTVPVEVVVAARGWDVLRGFGKYYWTIKGSTLAPQECGVIKNPDGDPSYIAFGLTDSKGEWGPGRIAQVPDLGSIKRNIFSDDEKVLTSATKAMCARRDATFYVMDDDFSTDCAPLKLTGRGRDLGQGPLLPLSSALYFHPNSYLCGEVYPGGPYQCEWTHYFLNISPSATGRELHATRGTKGGADAATNADSGESGDTRVLKAIAKAMAEEQQREAQAKADAAEAQARHLREQAAAREEKQKQILAADAAGNPDAKVPAQMIKRDQEDNRKRWAGTRQSPAAYDPQWIGQNMVIVGTVSRVEVDSKGYPQWVTIYFKESPDATFVVCSPYAEVFQERVGLNLSALVGKTLEAAGQVESPYCGPKASKGSIRVLESKQWQLR